MPWSCSCGQSVPIDVLICPKCALEKTHFSIVADSQVSVHRTFVVPKRKKLDVRRGNTFDAAGDPPDPRSWVETQQASVLTKAHLKQLHGAGRLPEPHDRISVWMHPGKKKDWTLRVLVPFEKRELGEHVLAFEPSPDLVEKDGWYEGQFVCTYGEEELEGVTFPNMIVLDVSDPTELGHAPGLELEGFRSRPKLVQLVAVEPPELALDFLEIEDVSFHFDSAVLMPDALDVPAGEQGEGGATGIEAVEITLRYAQRYPRKKLLIAGHTDSSGPDAYNLTLSRQRAENVTAFLMGDKPTWVDSSEAKHKPKDVQHILTWIAKTKAWNTDPKGVDGILGPNTHAATNAFRERTGRGSGPSGFTRADWEAVYDLYEDDLAQRLNISRDKLSFYRDKVRPLNPLQVGCGENFPAKIWKAKAEGQPPPPKVDGQKNQADRRVEILFFDPGEEPNLRATCHPDEETCNPSACPLYPTEVYVPKPIPTVQQAGYTLELVNTDGTAIPEATFTAYLEDDSEVEGIVGLDGTTTLIDIPDGDLEFAYDDPDDLVAKALAAKLSAALDAVDLEGVEAALQHTPGGGEELRDAYDRYHNTRTGQGLVEDLYSVFTGPEDVDDFEVALVLAGLEARGTKLADPESELEDLDLSDPDAEEEPAFVEWEG